jgi:hypothetical protein
MAGVDDAHAALAVEAHHALKDAVATLRVHAHGGLVQEQQPRLVDQPGGDVDPALHATGEGLHPLVRTLAQGNDAQHIPHTLLELPALQAVHAPEEVEVGPGAERRVEGQLLRHQPVDLFDAVQVGADIITTHPRRARRGRQEARQHGDEGGLAGAIGTQQAKDLALLDGKADAFDGDQIAVLFDQIFDLQDLRDRVHSSTTLQRDASDSRALRTLCFPHSPNCWRISRGGSEPQLRMVSCTSRSEASGWARR